MVAGPTMLAALPSYWSMCSGGGGSPLKNHMPAEDLKIYPLRMFVFGNEYSDSSVGIELVLF